MGPINHRKIFNAIAAGVPDAAEAAMKEHLAFVVREFNAKFFPPLAPAAP
jgi:DNA-binding FadR family transcriptional regulator